MDLNQIEALMAELVSLGSEYEYTSIHATINAEVEATKAKIRAIVVAPKVGAIESWEDGVLVGVKVISTFERAGRACKTHQIGCAACSAGQHCSEGLALGVDVWQRMVYGR